MQVRKLPVAQGLAWFRAAVDLGARNPKAVFGAALLFILVLYGLAIVLTVVAMALTSTGTPSPMTFLVVFVPLFIGMMVLLPILIGGLMHVIREAESGRPVRARDLFAPFSNGRAKGLAALGALQIVFAILGGMLMVAIAGPNYWSEYVTAMRAAMGGALPVMPEPSHPGLLLLVQIAFNYFTYAIMLLSVPLVMFSGAKLMDAVMASLRASVQNIGANLAAAALFVLGTIAAAIAAGLLVWIASLLGALVHQMVATVLSMAIMLAFGAVLLVVLAGGAYLAWRDTFDAPGTQPPPSFGGIEA